MTASPDPEPRVAALEVRVEEVAANVAATRRRVDTHDQAFFDLGVKVDANRTAINALGVQTAARFDQLERRVETGFNAVHARTNAVDVRLGAMNSRFNAIEARLSSMDSRFDTVEARLGSMDSRFDAVNSRFNTVESRFNEMDAGFIEMRARFGQTSAGLARLFELLGGANDDRDERP